MWSALWSCAENEKHTAWVTNNMGNRHIFSVRASMATVGAEFAWAESCHECSCAIESTVTIGSVACDQLVWVPAKINARLSDQI